MCRRVAVGVLALAPCSAAWVIEAPQTGRDPGPGHADPRARDTLIRPRITLALTGDILATASTWTTANALAGGHGHDYRPMFARLRPLVSSADLAICHLETPLTGPGVGISDYPHFAVPHQLAGAIRWAGYDGCSTASNHSLDRGTAGIRTTLDRLDRVGLRHAGTARSAAERGRITRYRVEGAIVAHLSFTWSFNGYVPRHAWEANMVDPDRIVSDARRARRHGADLVVVSLHWGVEHQHAVTSERWALARRLLRSHAIDLIIGHHTFT